MKRDLNWLKAKADIRIGCFDMVSMGYAIEMYNEDQVHIEKLEKEIASLKEQLGREQDVVDYYANKMHWRTRNGYYSAGGGKAYEITKEDIDENNIGGKLARSTQARREK